MAASDRIPGQREHGGVLIIPARIGLEMVRLLVDTGSAVSTLSPRSMERLGLDRVRFTGRRVIMTAAGTTIALPTGRIPSLRLGSAELHNVEIAVLDMPPRLNVDGLLGINVLGQFRVTFEFRSAVLVLRPDRTA